MGGGKEHLFISQTNKKCSEAINYKAMGSGGIRAQFKGFVISR